MTNIISTKINNTFFEKYGHNADNNNDDDVDADVITICKKKVKTLNFSKATSTINIDGTCCTKKTTLLSILKDKFNYNVSKVQYNNKIVNPDSYGPSMVGYICSGLIDQTHYFKKTFNDRSPLNCLEWSMLWRLMSVYYKKFGNQYPLNVTDDANACSFIVNDGIHDGDDVNDMVLCNGNNDYDVNDDDDDDFDKEADFSFLNVKVNVNDTNCLKQKMKEFYTYFDNECEKLKNWYVYAMMRQKLNTIVLIDSNEMRVYELLKQRQNGQDNERAKLNFYVPLQNRMYKNLYPDTVIDLNWFDGSNNNNEDQIDDDVSSIMYNIASFLDIVMTETYDVTKLALPIIVQNTYPISEKCLDLTKVNEETHTNRILTKINNLNTIKNYDGVMDDKNEQKMVLDVVTTDLNKNFLSHINGYVFGSSSDQYNAAFDFVNKKNDLVIGNVDAGGNNIKKNDQINNGIVIGNCYEETNSINNDDSDSDTLMDTYDDYSFDITAVDAVNVADDNENDVVNTNNTNNKHNDLHSNIIFKTYDLKNFINETKIDEF